MRQAAFFTAFMLIGLVSSAQMSDTDKIVGVWRMDSVNREGMSELDKAEMEEMKSFMFFTFATDSLVILPNFEDVPGTGTTQKGKYFLRDSQLFVLLDVDIPGDFQGVNYAFTGENYLSISMDEDIIYFKRD